MNNEFKQIAQRVNWFEPSGTGCYSCYAPLLYKSTISSGIG